MIDIQEKEVIYRVLSGEQDAYRILVERYHKGLIIHLYNFLGDEQSAEDIAQDAFIRAYDKLSQYNDNYAFSTWLYKIADNLAYRYLKKSRNHVDIAEIENALADDSPSLAEMTDKQYTNVAVSAAINKLPPTYKQVISLYYWDEFSYEAIAEIMDRPIGTIRTWLRRAKEAIREDLYGQI